MAGHERSMYIFPNFGDYSSQHHHDEMNSPDFHSKCFVQPSSWETGKAKAAYRHHHHPTTTATTATTSGLSRVSCQCRTTEKDFFVQEAAREKVGNICGELVGGDLVER
jgi:hypothetical protein